MVASTLLAGINVYALSGSNDKCVTASHRTDSGGAVGT
jgi:hypothetical protein